MRQTDAVRTKLEEGLPEMVDLDIRDGTSHEGEHLDLFLHVEGVDGKDWEILQPVTVTQDSVTIDACTIHASKPGEGDYDHVSILGSADDAKVPASVLTTARDLVERVRAMDLPEVAAEAGNAPTP